MKKRLGTIISLVLLSLGLACGSKVMVPPRIDLREHEVIGIINFTFSSRGNLGDFATRKFTEAARQDQGLVRIIPLGSEIEILKTIGYEQLNQAAIKAIGEEQNLKTILTGELVVSDIRPNIQITPGLGFLSISAEVDATLSVQMFETSTGASLWSSSASDTRTVGNISIFGGKNFAFDAKDPEKAYGNLINSLVTQVTRDFRVSWRRK
jgi:hypothetical protein